METAEVPIEVPVEQRLADQLYDLVKKSIDTKRITPASVVNIITTVMVAVEKLANTPGPQKKELALHVISRLVDEIPDKDAKEATQNAVALLGPAIIDTIVAASKGQIAINIPGLTADGKCCGKACCSIL